MKIIIGLLVICGLIFISTLNWRRSIQVVFFLVVVEGILRKWIVPQASDLIYFLKDFVMLGAYIGYFIISKEKKHKIKNNFVNILILLSSLWCIFQAFNPSLGSPIVGILGAKAYLLYLPLMWVIPSMFRSEEELKKFLRVHLLLTIPVGILGIVQFFSPVDSIINTYTPGAVAEVATFGYAGATNVRITGSFSHINSYTGYLLACFGLLIPFLSIKQSKWWRLIAIIEIFFVLINTFMTGSRTPVFYGAFVFAVYLAAKFLRQPEGIFQWGRRIIPATIVTAIAAFFGLRPAIDAFMHRVNYNNDLSGRFTSSFTEPLRFIQYKGFDGFGTGATHPGAATLRNVFGLPSGEVIPTGFEAEMGRVALDLGPLGFILWYGLRASIAIALWLVFWRLKKTFLSDLALVACLVQAVWFNGFLVYHHTFAVYYWFFSSFIFLLPRLEQIENFYKQPQRIAPNV